MLRRHLNISKSSSFFLFGPRGVGKSTLLKEELFAPGEALKVDLLLPEEFDRLVREPQSLIGQIRAMPPSRDPNQSKWVILDEVQKIPQLLDVVHFAIEELKVNFALSGSSARKLKRGGANLLAGRAFVYHLFPFTHLELEEGFDLATALNFGTLPRIYQLQAEVDRNEFLRSYTHTYLKEEVISEQVVRVLPPFRRFLEIAAQMNGQVLNYAAIARDVGVDDKTVKNYYTVLEDTLMGFFVESYHRSIRKTQINSPRFYFFDTGVTRALNGTLSSQYLPGTYAWGKAFEHFVIAECVRLNSYLRRDFRFFYIRTQAGAEIDLVIERPGDSTLCLEIKSSTEIKESDIKHLESLGRDVPGSGNMLLSLDPRPQQIKNTLCLPWQEGLRRIGLVCS